MAKAKKRVAARNKRSKRGKASDKPARKKSAKRATAKRAKSKVRRAGMRPTRPVAKKKRAPMTVAKKAARKSPKQEPAVRVETTIVDVIEEPVPGVVVVTEYESVRTTTPISPGSEPKHGDAAGPEREEQ